MPRDRIGLLFLVIDGLSQPDVWRRFLAGHQGQYAAYAHAKNPGRVGSDLLCDILIPEYVRTHHSMFYPHHVLVQAQLALLRHALADPRIGKFVYVTQTCVPIAPFDEVYDLLLADDQSWITCAGGFWPERYARLAPDSGIRPDQFGTSSCWVALSRPHAEILVDAERQWLPKFIGVPAADEHYAPTILKMAGCAPECKPYNPTYVDWVRGNPYTYEQVTAEDLDRLSRGPYLFARKFSPSCNIAALWEDLLQRRSAQTTRFTGICSASATPSEGLRLRDRSLASHKGRGLAVASTP